ncbi:MAG: NFACT family protein [Trueperaceae bacterium]|nr:NFACT family protein [Trueperaceae bacterium]
MVPPNPRLELRFDQPQGAGAAATNFQALLRARAVGPLIKAEQPALDRVTRLRFGPREGFVAAPPVDLIFEATGRNCNLILVDDAGTILGSAREVGAEMNRYRQVRPGATYRPPPPYDKIDPRRADDEELAGALRGRTPAQVKRVVDGVGPELTRATLALAGLPQEARLEGEALEAFVSALREVARDPRGASARALDRPDVARLQARQRRQADLNRVRSLLRERLRLAEKRLRDVDKALEAAEDADRVRTEGDLLLAHATRVPAGVREVTLPAFEGGEVTLALDPSSSAAQNAERRYRQARKREDRAERALDRQDDLRAEVDALRRELDGLDDWDDDSLRARRAKLEPAREDRRTRGPGARYPAPHDFTVLVGRNARDNVAITFRVARSLDVWLHVQGWQGSHVIVQAGGREVPFDTILFAARLAAGHSKASGGDNVPVDYTLRKYVWKVKGGPPGAVHYTQQKTVFVTPSRNPAAERA